MDIIFSSISFIITSLLIILTQKFFLQKKYIDKVNYRSSHSAVSTRNGGLSLFLSIFFISVYFYLKGYEIYNFSLLIPLSLIMLVGLYDDVNGFDFKLKFIFQIIAAKIIVDNGIIIDNLHGFGGIYELSRVTAQLFTIFIFVAIINSINFIDGVDGLAISIVILFICGFEFFSTKPSSYSNLSSLIIGSLAPLYYFNYRKKNKVFLGDSGSLFLGGVVSIYVIKILSNNYTIQPEFDLHKLVFVISILFYPIIDIIRIFFLRLFKGKSPFKADRNHLHHLILNETNSHFLTTIIILIASIILNIIIQLLF